MSDLEKQRRPTHSRSASESTVHTLHRFGDGSNQEEGFNIGRKELEATPTIAPEVADKTLGDDDFPDGGLEAWLVLLGALCSNTATFGYINSWGYSLCFLPALVTGRLFDLGYFKIPYIFASAVLITATFLIAECKVYWQFLLAQGFAVGLASGTIFGPVLGIASHWFKRRRGMALGIIACGSSIGGTIFPIAFRRLEVEVGFKWTMRIFGFMLLFMLGVSNLTLKRRLPPVNVSGGLFNLSVFKSAPFCTYTASSFICFLGLYTVLTYIDVSGPMQGVSVNFSFYLVSIANASSGAGRLGSGYLTDHIGALNVMTPLTAITGVITYIWPFVHGQGAMIAIAVLYGLASGAYVGLLAAPMIAFGETHDVGRRTGMYLTILSFGALAGPPISGAINVATGSYKAVGIYAGTVIMIAVALMCLTRHLVLKSLWGKF
ncbi:hypothetical protein EW146_g10183 [Bondarzewia mesenterica]|uniref:Major facilitator superfamily (MFS) profile domain-containing protein n=1 Tax=Bondarzewia mesenterica TaxID=1095465 RepID=A0A4S4KZM5_9AGAM|nr:hypothetical protein EW146_g10183 [Bondarzewia mesenterica]